MGSARARALYLLPYVNSAAITEIFEAMLDELQRDNGAVFDTLLLNASDALSGRPRMALPAKDQDEDNVSLCSNNDALILSSENTAIP